MWDEANLNADPNKYWQGSSPRVLGVELIYPAGVPVGFLSFIFFFFFSRKASIQLHVDYDLLCFH